MDLDSFVNGSGRPAIPICTVFALWALLGLSAAFAATLRGSGPVGASMSETAR